MSSIYLYTSPRWHILRRKAHDGPLDTGVDPLPLGVDLVKGSTCRIRETCCAPHEDGLEAASLSNHSTRHDEIVENLL